MKTIGIDARLVRQTGVGVYIRNLVNNLASCAPRDFKFVIYVMSADSHFFKLPIKRFSIKVADFRWHSLSEQIGFLKKISDDRLDLMHFTYFTYPVLYTKPFVITIHDLTPVLFKTGRASLLLPLIYEFKHSVFKFVVKKAVDKSATIITPTETVKKQVVDYYKADKEKISVTYEGISREFVDAAENKKLKELFPRPFFLYVSNFYPHKNSELLINAFIKTNIKDPLVLVGPNDFFANRLKKKVIFTGVADRIFFYHNPTFPDLTFFYKNARALIHPSLSEGFGLPLVEALYFNCPIIASDITVFREILGDNFVAFDPKNKTELVRIIEDFSKKKIKRQKNASSNVLEERFSFERMAKKTVEIYKNVLKKDD